MLTQLLKFIGTAFIGLDARDLKCFCQLILAVIKERTVNLTKLSLHCHYTSKGREARYRRLQRFVSRSCVTQQQMASLIMSFFKGRVLLALDRTNWSFGKFQINILVLSVIYKSYSFPLFWTFLPHKGNSSPEERITLITHFVEAFGVSRIQALLMDREFIGFIWLGFLTEQKITFHVRLKNNIKIGRGTAELRSPHYDFVHLRPLEKIEVPGLRKIGLKKENLNLFISVMKSQEGELITIASNQDQAEALDRYKLRWGIETLFGCLKTRGFCLEDTHLKDTVKIGNLFLILSFAFFWAFKIGEWINEKGPIKLKTHKRKAFSLFRCGLEALILAKNAFKTFFVSFLSGAIPKNIPPKILPNLGVI